MAHSAGRCDWMAHGQCRWRRVVASSLVECACGTAVDAACRGQNLLTSRYDATTRQLTTEVAASASLEDCVFTLFLVEDGIPSLQYLSNGRRTLDYVHRHVLRQLLTPRQGIAVAHQATSQTSWQHTVTLPPLMDFWRTSPSFARPNIPNFWCSPSDSIS